MKNVSLKSMVFTIVALIGCVFIIILICEFMTRMHEARYYKKMILESKKSIYTADPDIGFGFIPDATVDQDDFVVQFNADGFRDINHNLKKDKYRILAVGDSFVFGWRAKYEDTFLTRIERLYTQKIEIIKMGIPGNGIAKDLKIIKFKGLKYHPDLIIVNFYVGSDFMDDLAPESKVINNIQIGALPFDAFENIDGKLYPYSKSRLAAFVRWKCLRFSIFFRRGMDFFGHLLLDAERAVFNAVFKKFVSLKAAKHIEDNFSKRQKELDRLHIGLRERNQISKYLRNEMVVFHKDYSDYLNKAVSDVFKRIKEMDEIARMNKAEFVLVILPSDIQVNSQLFENAKIVLWLSDLDYDVLKPNKLLTDFCRKNNIKFIDAYPALKQAFLEGQQLYLPDYDRHWTAKGHEVVSLAVKKGLDNLNLIK